MASKALQLRIQQAERELHELKELAAQLEIKLAALQRSLGVEEGEELPESGAQPAQAARPAPKVSLKEGRAPPRAQPPRPPTQGHW
jgi:hypothetical protein